MLLANVIATNVSRMPRVVTNEGPLLFDRIRIRPAQHQSAAGDHIALTIEPARG
jgi:hypothetical protein